MQGSQGVLGRCPAASDVQVAVDQHDDQLHHSRQDGRSDGKTGGGAGRYIPTQTTPMPGIRETAVQIRKADRVCSVPMTESSAVLLLRVHHFVALGRIKSQQQYSSMEEAFAYFISELLQRQSNQPISLICHE